MDFVPTHENDLILVVRSTRDASGFGRGLFDSLVSSFEKTFVTEGRWALILSGLCVTAIVTLGAGVLGTLFGFAIVMLRRRNNRVAVAIVNVFEGLMSRLPILVVLMVFYYVIFASSELSGTVVAVLVFSLSFGATAGSLMWSSVQAVDEGQGEAAMLEVDYHNLVDWGIGPEEVGSGGDPVSEALIAGYAKRVDSDDPAVICYEIG